MPKLEWDKVGERTYETGVSKAVLYLLDAEKKYTKAYAWNGITKIGENPTGADANALYADNIKYLNLIAAEDFEGSIEAYTYPDEFAQCDGSASLTPGVSIGQQTRLMFGLCYRTEYGNDTNGNDYGYKLHMIYGCNVSPSSKDYETINDSPEAITFSWDLTTTPVSVNGFKPTATVTVDSTKVDAEKLKALEDILYGRDADTENNIEALSARLPLPDEIKEILSGD